jgi:alpha-amylase/alpha-mannosidase (GH57 family)
MPDWVAREGIKASFNLTPSLIEQLELYLQGGSDIFLDLTKVPAKELTLGQRLFITTNFFNHNHDQAIKPFPRYQALLEKKRRGNGFTIQELLDLQVWFNLAMFGFNLRTNDPVVAQLIKKGRDFTEVDKMELIEVQKRVIREVLISYRQLQEEGTIAVTVSPYVHPIVPLVINQQSALEGMPGSWLPQFSHPDDARAQLHLAQLIYQRTFGRPPLGMWPSEGSVSMEMLPLIRQAAPSIRYLLTDADIRRRSEPYLADHEWWGRFQPWESHGLNLFFRDRGLSDDIGFVVMERYARTAYELFGNIAQIISAARGKSPGKPVIPIVLDGENLQPSRINDAHAFFKTFYGYLVSDPEIVTILPEEYLALYPKSAHLTRLFAGSWIAGNFSTWTGDVHQHAGYQRIHRAEGLLERLQVEFGLQVAPEERAKIAEEIYTLARQKNLFTDYRSLSSNARAYLLMLQAESSCFRWWFGGTQGEAADLGTFDQQYRQLLAQAYQELGLPIPADLRVSLYQDRPWGGENELVV